MNNQNKHHMTQPPTTNQADPTTPLPKLQPPPLNIAQQLPRLIYSSWHHMVWSEYPIGQFGSALLAVAPPLPASCPSGRAQEAGKVPDHHRHHSEEN